MSDSRIEGAPLLNVGDGGQSSVEFPSESAPPTTLRSVRLGRLVTGVGLLVTLGALLFCVSNYYMTLGSSKGLGQSMGSTAAAPKSIEAFEDDEEGEEGDNHTLVPGRPVKIKDVAKHSIVQDSLKFAIEFLRLKIEGCHAQCSLKNIEIISAHTQVTSPLTVILEVDLTSSCGDTIQKTIKIPWQVDHSRTSRLRMKPKLVNVVSRQGSTPAWCELLLKRGRELDWQTDKNRRLYGWATASNKKEANHARRLEDTSVKYTPATCKGSDSLPTEYNLRYHQIHSGCFDAAAVTSQGGCGCCGIFAAKHSVDGRLCLQNQTDFNNNSDGLGRRYVSPQSSMSCGWHNAGCDGGHSRWTFEEWKRGGAPLERDYPFNYAYGGQPWHAENLPCQWGYLKKHYRVTSYYDLPYNKVEDMKRELYCHGPFSITYHVYANLGSTPGKVVDNIDADYVGYHASVIVGWGILDGVEYWEVQNSWGSEWSDDGYVKMKMGINLAGMESGTISAARVERTDASWVYNSDFGECRVPVVPLALCPSGYKEDQVNEKGNCAAGTRCCIAYNDGICTGPCAKDKCRAFGGAWIEVDLNHNPYTCQVKKQEIPANVTSSGYGIWIHVLTTANDGTIFDFNRVDIALPIDAVRTFEVLNQRSKKKYSVTVHGTPAGRSGDAYGSLASETNSIDQPFHDGDILEELPQAYRGQGIKCVSNSVESKEVKDSLCPIYVGQYEWPNKTAFPRDLPRDATVYAEMPPVAKEPCVLHASSECTAAKFCSGVGSVVEVAGSCTCSCPTGFVGEHCESCDEGYEGHPTCRESCTGAKDCSGHGIATGVKWKNEDGTALDTCACTCDFGFQGDRCEVKLDCPTPLNEDAAHPGRCGPTYGRCNAKQEAWAIYCDEFTEWCGAKVTIGSCTRDYPYAYRPKANFDYCCRTANDASGLNGANGGSLGPNRSGSCEGSRYQKCSAPPCSDYGDSTDDTYDYVTSGCKAPSTISSSAPTSSPTPAPSSPAPTTSPSSPAPTLAPSSPAPTTPPSSPAPTSAPNPAIELTTFTTSIGASPGLCWVIIDNTYGPGFASGISTAFSQQVAKEKCIELGGACKAVTCEGLHRQKCTVRASSDLKSSNRESSYLPLACDSTTTLTTSTTMTTTTSTTTSSTTSRACWPQFANMYSPGYAAGISTIFTLEAAKDKCMELVGHCKAVTCGREEQECTVRGSSELVPHTDESTYLLSSCAETTTVTTATTATTVTTTSSRASHVCWIGRENMYGPGHAAGISTVFAQQAAKDKCVELGEEACEAVTCKSGGKECTVRASSDLKASSNGEFTYVRGEAKITQSGALFCRVTMNGITASVQIPSI